MNIPQSVILEKLDEQPIVGWSHRPGQEWVELAYETVPARDQALNEVITFSDYDQTLTPIKSRRIGGPEVFIQLVNVPQNRNAEYEIREVFAEYGYISDIAPVTYTDSKTDKWSRRWNLILNVPEDTDFIMHPIIKIVGCDVAVFWQGGTPVCSICFTKGHYSQRCSPNHRRKAYKKRKDRLIPTPRLSNEKQQLIKAAKKKSEEEGMSLVDAIAEVALAKGQMTEETIQSVKAASDALTLVARLQAEGAAEETVTRQEAELQSQISLANRGYAQLPTEQEFTVVKSAGQQRRERKAKTPQPTSPPHTSPQPSSSRTPRPSTPTNKHPQSQPTTPSKGGARKRQRLERRSNVTQDACCQYLYQVASVSIRDVEKVWKMTPSQYDEYKMTWDAKTYKNMSDWERKYKPVTFVPSDAGIKAQRGRSPSPTPRPTNPSPPKTSEKPNLFSIHKKNPVPTTSTAKLRIVEGAPPITVQFQVEGPLTPGQFTHGTVKIARKARISELKKEIEITIGRKDFFLMFMGYRLAMGDMVGERIREGQKVFVIGSWNTKDPQPAKPKSKQSDQGFNLSIGAPERHTTLQYIVTESTLGSSVQDQVATALNLKEYEPIITFKHNPIALNKTLNGQGINATSHLSLSTVTNMKLHVHYNLSDKPYTYDVIIPFNKTGYDLRARVAKKVNILKGHDFQIINSIGDPISDSSLLRTVTQDGSHLAIANMDGEADINLDSESDDEMEVDPIEAKNIRLQFKDAEGHLCKADFEFDITDKTVQHLYEEVKEYFVAEDNETSGKLFTLKYNFTHMRLTDKITDIVEDPNHCVFDVEWGKALTSASQEAIVIS